MARFVLFLVGAVLLARLLSVLPFVGGLFRATGFLGIWIAALLLSWALTRWGQRAVRVRRHRAELRRLTAVDSPHNHGKAGALLLAQGRLRRAVEHLGRAVEGEPEVAEWHYRFGCALFALGRREEALRELEATVSIDEEHAYGAAQLRLAEARLAGGDATGALEALAVFERNHGPTPESAYRRGRSLRAAGRGEEARAAFAEVDELARNAARYQRGEAELWRWRARLRRLVG